MTDEKMTAAEAAAQLVEQAREAHTDQVDVWQRSREAYSADPVYPAGTSAEVKGSQIFIKGPDGITRRVSDKLLVTPPKSAWMVESGTESGAERRSEHLSLRGHQILTVATSNLAAGDYEAALEGMSELREQDVDPLLSILSTLMQIAIAVGTNHQIVALAERDQKRAESAG